MQITIKQHGVPKQGELSPLQHQLLNCAKRVRIADAPTGAGKSYAFQWAMLNQQARILFIVPTRRLAQNLTFGLKKDLKKAGWDDAKIHAKVVMWSSDATKHLQETDQLKTGKITVRRLREVYELDETRAGGEIIFAIPEVVSYLLLRPFQTTGQAETGIFDFLGQFDHIVFDEFHTIDPRGFGMAAIFARLAATLGSRCRAKVNFLSATPLEIEPVLLKLGTPKEQIEVLSETVISDCDSETNRVIHGKVILRFVEADTLAEVISSNIDKIRQEAQQNRLTVSIYNNLGNLQRQRAELADLLDTQNINKPARLLINSIDDSREGEELEFVADFTVGRDKNVDDFKVLIATSSVEMGVTFNSRLLFMEPGFEAFNFVQRYGRAARGEIDGEVIVRWDSRLSEKMPWLRGLLKWVNEHKNQEVTVKALTDQIKNTVSDKFDSTMLNMNSQTFYGALPNRTVHTAGLYWVLLQKHRTNNRYAKQRLFESFTGPVNLIAGKLAEFAKMEKCLEFGRFAKKWRRQFEMEAATLRTIGNRIKVVEDRGSVWISEEFLQRETYVLERGQLKQDNDGNWEVHISGSYLSYFRDKKNYMPNDMWVGFPHTDFVAKLENVQSSSDLITKWCKAFDESRSGKAARAWQKWESSMYAAKALVQLTGLVVNADSSAELDTLYGFV